MKVTVCELPNTEKELEEAWEGLVKHAKKQQSDLILLPEMPFYKWLAHTKEDNAVEWKTAIENHLNWIDRFKELEQAIVISTRPIIRNNIRHNQGYIWDLKNSVKDSHTKYYLPNEAGYWEASWYQRGSGDFLPIDTPKGKIGFMICTELWFFQEARKYGKELVDIIVCPRVTPASSAQKWVAGGQAAAVVSGAYCLSSNLSGSTPQGSNFAGTGWIIEPEEGDVLGVTSANHPFLTIDIDLEKAKKAKKSYPRYVLD